MTTNWTCRDCGFSLNWKAKTRCMHCSEPRSEESRTNGEGSWVDGFVAIVAVLIVLALIFGAGFWAGSAS
jgi:hypothetical protein